MDNKPNIKLIFSENTWIEGEAIRQLQKTSELEGIQYSVGLPDLHPGRGNPVGAAFISKGIIYPYIVGNDVGCGVALFSTEIKTNKIKKDKWLKKLKNFEEPYDGDLEFWRTEFGLNPSSFDISLGTIGGGNHFAELQTIEKIMDQKSFDDLKLDKNYVMLLIHSGSRSIGEALLRRHTEKYGAKGLLDDSEDAIKYLETHEHALKWAKCNRALISYRFASELGSESNLIIDVCHNSITKTSDDGNNLLWLHRKGAAASDSGYVVIPGSRGTLSYLVKAKGDQKANAWSLPHGAGRKWNRGSCKERLSDRFNAKSLIQTEIGSYVICEDKDLLYEEAPYAYKNIDSVIGELLKADLIEVIATLKPVITYKVRKS
ncbi:MAG: RNA ligase RtcB family protein [Desulfobacterales bacterium]|nr:RNA ligase RtcB family protein [Desulfobacterales bacterium]